MKELDFSERIISRKIDFIELSDQPTNGPLSYFGPDGWRDCPPASLRGHIVNAHFQPMTLANTGVARFDIEVCSYRMISLDWVVKKAYAFMERSDGNIHAEIVENGDRIDRPLASAFTIDDYRIALVQNLKFIEQLDLASIDWDRVERSLPHTKGIDLVIERDSKDASFFRDTLPLSRNNRREFIQVLELPSYS